MVVFFTPSARADAFYDGLVAYNTGDFARAARIWAPLAARGDGKAQSGLGILYSKGLGVPADPAKAADLFLKAAMQGVVEAQMFLGVMHLNGDGVVRSRVLAYMWSDLALSAGYEQAIDFREHVARSMTPAQIAEARRLAVKWQRARAAAQKAK